ncbi:MAG: hypothetical protein GF313_07905 [Caldithrix sp.]|nr:hypothetical protein [Caldithrix sp.]
MIYVKSTDAYANIPSHLIWYLTTGQGIFETLLYDEVTLWFWERHALRLDKALKFFNVKFDSKTMWSNLLDYCKQNYVESRLRIKVAVLFPLNVYTKEVHLDDVLVQIEEMDKEAALPESITLQLQPSPFSADNKLTSIKTINYGYNLFGFALANNEQFGDVLFCNTNGFILETSRANIFGIREGQIFTPELQNGMLPGTVRSILLDEMDVTEIKIHIAHLAEFDCFFLTGAVREILPVESINDHTYQMPCPKIKEIGRKWESIKMDYRRKSS